MDLPTIVKQERHDKGPPLFTWNDVGVYTPRISFMLPGGTEGAVAMLFEEAQLQYEKNFYVPLFETFLDAGELLDRVHGLRHAYTVQKIYARRSPADADFISFRNRGLTQRLNIMDPPHIDRSQGSINYHLNLLKDMLRPGRERVFFPKESDIPRILASVPEMAGAVKDVEHRALACLCYGIAALIHDETSERAGDTSRAKTDYNFLDYGM